MSTLFVISHIFLNSCYSIFLRTCETKTHFLTERAVLQKWVFLNACILENVCQAHIIMILSQPSLATANPPRIKPKSCFCRVKNRTWYTGRKDALNDDVSKLIQENMCIDIEIVVFFFALSVCWRFCVNFFAFWLSINKTFYRRYR